MVFSYELLLLDVACQCLHPCNIRRLNEFSISECLISCHYADACTRVECALCFAEAPMHHHVQVIQPVSMTRTLLSNPFRATRKIHATTASSSIHHLVVHKALKQS